MAAVASISTLVETLRQHRLLEPLQLYELTNQGLQDRFSEPQALAQEMIKRQWLTQYQVRELFAGRLAGLVLGSYVIQEKLGEGPIGSTYKARHVHMRRVVTLNVIREDLLAEPEAVERFYREIQIASQLSSANILHAYDAGPIGRTHFFAMEFVQGTELSQLVKDSGPLPVEKACSYVYQAALGLRHAFEKGLLHRDIKPANLVVLGADGSNPGVLDAHSHAPGGLVKIRNLGLTLLQPLARGAGGPTWVADTVDYLAPERGDGDPGDIRSDLYSLGCVFYYLLSGQVPYPGGKPEDKPRRHREEDPVPMDLLVTGLPATVRAILTQLMARDPNERFQTPGELAEALGPVLGLDPNASKSLPQPPRPTLLPAESGPAGETLEDMVQTMPLHLHRPRQRTRRQFWVSVAGAVFALLVVIGLALVVWNQLSDKTSPTGGNQAGDPALKEYEALAVRSRKSQTNLDELAADLRAFRINHPGGDLAGRAAVLLGQLSSPLDPLIAKSIRPEQMSLGMPTDVVAVLGEARQRHWGQASSVAFHPDGKRLFSGGIDAIRIWDAETMNELGAIPAPGGDIVGMTFAADGGLTTVGTDGTYRVWNLAAAQPVQKDAARLPPFQLPMVVSPDGKMLAAAGKDRIIRLWSLPAKATDKPVMLSGHAEDILALAFTADGTTLASADKSVRLWDLVKAIPEQRAILEGHKLPVVALAFTPDGKFLVSGSNDKTVRLWDVATAQPHQPDQLPGHTVEVTSVACSADGMWVATGSKDGAIRVWEWNQGQPAGNGGLLGGHGDSVRALAFAAARPVLASASADQTVRLWDLAKGSGKERRPLANWPTVVRALAVSPENDALALAGSDGNLRLWQLTGIPAERWQLQAPGLPIHSLAFDPAGGLVASAHQDQKVRLWKRHINRLEEGPILDGPTNFVAQVAFSCDGKELASAGNDRNAVLWSMGESGFRSRKLGGSVRELRAVAYSADGSMLADVAADGVVRVWKLTFVEPKVQGSMQVPAGVYQAVDFAPSGTVLAIGGQDAKVRLWDVATGPGEPVMLLDGHKAPVTFVRFAADNKSLVSVGINGQVIWWEMPAATRKKEWQLPGGLQTAALAPDGRHLVIANNNGTVYILRLGPGSHR